MATITTDTFLDGGVARTANETFDLVNASFTIRTDTRWHANAPAGMTGTVGRIMPNTGYAGSLTIDGTKVRWLKYSGGSGTVPAIGTTITQGGVSGYLLGVWFDLEYAPEAVGNAVPATGYIKFREVTGGTFTAGALSGIAVTATGPDVVGWMEIVMDPSSSTSLAGNPQTIQGDYFVMGTTTGVRGQTLGTPTNGGGANTHVLGVQIETAPGSGTYEWYPTLSATVGGASWTAANLTTDARNKFVESAGNGVIRIGSDATGNAIAYCPPAGCAVRIPNLFFRIAASTSSRHLNSVPGSVSRPALGTNGTIDKCHSELIIAGASSHQKFNVKNSVNDASWTVKMVAGTTVIDNVCVGGLTQTSVACTLQNLTDAIITDSKFSTSGSSLGSLRLINATTITMNDIEVVISKARGTSSPASVYMQSANDVQITNLKTRGCAMNIQSSNQITVANIDYVDRVEGPTTSSTAMSIVTVNSCNGVTIDGVTWGDGGTLSNCHPYGGLISASSNASKNVKLRNVGTRLNLLNSGSTSSLFPTGIVNSSIDGDTNWKLQRIYLSGTRNGLGAGVTKEANAGWVIEDVITSSGSTVIPVLRGPSIRKAGFGLPTNSASPSVGVHWVDVVNTDNTTGQIRWYGSPPISETAGSNYIVAAPHPFTGYQIQGYCPLMTAGDYLISESDLIKGHTGFVNSSFTSANFNGSNGVTVQYDLDTGSGFSGTWKTATGANLSTETGISPSGFRMRLRLLQPSNPTSAGGYTWISFATTTSIQAQADNLHTLDTVTLGFEGLIPGSEVRAYVGNVNDASNAVEIGGVESTTGDTWSFTHSSSGQSGYIVILAMGYQPVVIPRTYAYTDSTLLIQPVVDRNYFNPA
jgi:hypothetical protein